ncbi:unnamed protein product, partial [Oikopleura dioica]
KVSQRSLQICIPLLRIGRKQRGKNHWKENYRVKAGLKDFKIVIEYPTNYLSIRKFLNLRKVRRSRRRRTSSKSVDKLSSSLSFSCPKPFRQLRRLSAPLATRQRMEQSSFEKIRERSSFERDRSFKIYSAGREKRNDEENSFRADERDWLLLQSQRQLSHFFAPVSVDRRKGT